jgi:hypothetical protein
MGKHSSLFMCSAIDEEKSFYDLDTSMMQVGFQTKGARYLGIAARKFLTGQQASVKLAK